MIIRKIETKWGTVVEEIGDFYFTVTLLDIGREIVTFQYQLVDKNKRSGVIFSPIKGKVSLLGIVVIDICMSSKSSKIELTCEPNNQVDGMAYLEITGYNL